MPIRTFQNYGFNAANDGRISVSEADENLISRWEILTRHISIYPGDQFSSYSGNAYQTFDLPYNDIVKYSSWQFVLKVKPSNSSTTSTKLAIKCEPRWQALNAANQGNALLSSSQGKIASFMSGQNQKVNYNFNFSEFPATNTSTYGLNSGNRGVSTFMMTGMVHLNKVNKPMYTTEQTWYSNYWGIPLRERCTVMYNAPGGQDLANQTTYEGIVIGGMKFTSEASSTTEYNWYFLGQRIRGQY